MRWVSHTRVSHQRAGVLLAVLSAASPSRPATLDAIVRGYARLIRQKVRVPPNEAESFGEYLSRQRLWKRYPELQRRQPQTLRGAPVEIQDLWLADARMPSASGAVTDEVVSDAPQLATALGIVRPKNFTVTERGRALGVIAERECADIRQGRPEGNGFLLSAGAATFMSYVLLNADFDFMQAAYRRALCDLPGRFSRAQFGARLADACDDLREVWSQNVRSAADRAAVRRLSQLSRSIASAHEARTWGGGRPPEQAATLRLEPFVDCGLLTRNGRYDYEYELSADQRSFFQCLTDPQVAPTASSFLDESLFEALMRGRGYTAVRLDDSRVWQAISDSYSSLRSGLGYVSLREVVALANARLAEEDPGSCFEVVDAFRVARQRQQESPRSIRFGAQRRGGFEYIRILGRGGR